MRVVDHACYTAASMVAANQTWGGRALYLFNASLEILFFFFFFLHWTILYSTACKGLNRGGWRRYNKFLLLEIVSAVATRFFLLLLGGTTIYYIYGGAYISYLLALSLSLLCSFFAKRASDLAFIASPGLIYPYTAIPTYSFQPRAVVCIYSCVPNGIPLRSPPPLLLLLLLLLYFYSSKGKNVCLSIWIYAHEDTTRQGRMCFRNPTAWI